MCDGGLQLAVDDQLAPEPIAAKAREHRKEVGLLALLCRDLLATVLQPASHPLDGLGGAHDTDHDQRWRAPRPQIARNVVQEPQSDDDVLAPRTYLQLRRVQQLNL